MALLDVHVMGLDELKIRLGRMADQSKRVMRIAVNDTARQARTKINREIRNEYVVKQRKVHRALTLIPATNATLTAILLSRGRPLPLSDFQTRKNGVRKAGQGHQLKSTTMSQIIKEGNKSFMETVPNHGSGSDHKGLFYRVSDTRYPIKQVYASSVPAMLGGRRVYGKLSPMIHKDLQYNLERHIDLVLRGI